MLASRVGSHDTTPCTAWGAHCEHRDVRWMLLRLSKGQVKPHRPGSYQCFTLLGSPQQALAAGPPSKSCSGCNIKM